MKLQELALVKLMEECDEVSHRCAKAIRFTLEEIQPGQELTNGQRIQEEAKDLIVILQWMYEHGILNTEIRMSSSEIEARMLRIDEYMKYSKNLGTLTD